MNKQLILMLLVSTMLFGCQKKENKSDSAPTKKTETTELAVTTDVNEYSPTAHDGTSGATGHVKSVSLTGVIVLPPDSRVMVSVSMPGIVRSTTLVPGNYVKKGSVIITMENPDFIALQQEYIESEAKSRTLQMEYERQQTMMKDNATTEKKVEESKSEYVAMRSKYEAAKSQLAMLGVDVNKISVDHLMTYIEVKAPISGYVSNVTVNPGKYVEAGMSMCDVIDKTGLMLKLTAYEKDLTEIGVGDSLRFIVNGISDQKFAAKVVSIGQSVNEHNRSIEVYATIAKHDAVFRPGMYVTATMKE